MFTDAGLASPWETPTSRSSSAASHVTASNDDEGFAQAIERFVLGADAQQP